MNFDFQKASQAIVPSLTNSWKQAVGGAAWGGLLTFSAAGAIFGGILSGLGNASVQVFEAGKGPKPGM